MTMQLSSVIRPSETLPRLYFFDPFALTNDENSGPPFICGPSALQDFLIVLNEVDLSDEGLPRGGIIKPRILTDDVTAGDPIAVSAWDMRFLRNLLNDMRIGQQEKTPGDLSTGVFLEKAESLRERQ